ncbi:uncharacterized protein [Antedon mediterranea]|uniref:uncharacterized protein isoform X2 n=1 Tax=Antedon mediterranea TaxID=105859 RepID=UPI003AF51634
MNNLWVIFVIGMVQMYICDANVSRYIRRAADCIPRGDALSYSMCDRVIPIPDSLRQEFSLDSFYYNYTYAYGIPILSSEAVSEAAMLRACYIVRFMLADRQDVRNALHNNCARYSIIGLEELTNEIPEYSYLDDDQNDRARGFGGTLNNPVSTVAEENLLCFPRGQDRWYKEDIGVHEFAHAIHIIGMNTLDSDFNNRLKVTYNEAIAAGLWESTYAATNRREYFAEGVQKFFNVDVVQEHTDGVHNNISNRQELFDYDPGLYDLALETFPCANIFVSRCEEQSLIETQLLMMDCNKAGATSTTEGTTSDTEGTTSATEGTTSATEGTTSTTEGTTSDTEGTTIATEGTTSATEGTTSATEGTTSATEGTTSDTEGTTSDTEGTTSATEGTTSATEGTTSDTEGTTSDTEGTTETPTTIEDNSTTIIITITYTEEKTSDLQIGIIAGACGGAVFIVILLIISVCVIHNKLSNRSPKPIPNGDKDQEDNELSEI